MKTKQFIAVIFICLLGLANFANASTIKQINISGNKRIEDFIIKKFLSLREGDVYSEEKANEGLKKIYASGLFSAVNLDYKANKMQISVRENPLIHKIIFEGNSKFKSTELAKEAILKKRSVFSKSKLREELERIKKLYANTGRLQVKVTPKTILLPHNRITLIYEIEEGHPTLIRNIIFVGNNNVKAPELRSVIASKQHTIFQSMFGKSQFNPDKVEYDKILLSRFYGTIGYPDFKVKSAIADFSKQDNSVTITFVIEEGKKYKVGDISLVNNIVDPKYNEALRKLIKTKENTIYNREEIQQDINELTNYLSQKGFPFSDIDIKLQKVSQNRMNLTYYINKAERVFLNRIKIIGNVHTYDYVIRRNIDIAEGDAYNIAKLEQAKDRIRSLNYFETVEFTPLQTENTDRMDLEVKVKEKSTAGINIAAGYSSVDKFFGKLGISEKNLFGKGQYLSIEGIKYLRNKFDVNLSFTEPYFLSYPLAVGFDVVNSRYIKDQTLSALNTAMGSSLTYSTKEKVYKLRAAYDINRHLSHNVRYIYRDVEIYDFEANTSEFIKDQPPKSKISSLGHSLYLNKTNKIMSPTSGYGIRFEQEFAGLGGDSKYIKHNIKGNVYYPLTSKINLKLYGKYSNIRALADRIKITDRFFNGESDIKGFSSNGMGPRDAATLEALGGNNFYNVGAEIAFPLGISNDLDIKGHGFIEGGGLYGLDLTPAQQATAAIKILQADTLRLSAGVGLEWKSRIGPLRLDFAFPIMKEKFDRVQTFVLSFEQPL